MTQQDASYWENRWQTGQTGWDIGYAAPAIMAYLEALEDKSLKILIPGAGNAYEATRLHQLGFTQVYVCDWASSAFSDLRNRQPDFPQDHLIVQDFFELEGQFDIMVEQTFFCAIPPARRADYVQKAHDLLQPGGRLIGLLFDRTFHTEGPPFGGNRALYSELFGTHFELQQLSNCTNSIPPRQGYELFIEALPQSQSEIKR